MPSQDHSALISLIGFENATRETRRKFVEECKVLVQLHHKNIVQVLGWCENRRLRAVVPEWTEGQSVETWLLESNPTWKHRLRLMKGVVSGTCYLQENWPEVGYDLKTSSVVLSNNIEPLISRFKIEDHSNITKNIYKLGVFLLEIMANRRPQNEFEGREAGFVIYIRTHYPTDLQKVIDENMKLTENVFDQAKQVIELGLMCTDQSSNRRLNLRQIFDIISKAYESFTVVASPYQKRSHGDRGK